MNKTLVIHPSDPSTNFLKLVYKNKGYDVINDYERLNDKEQLKEIIKQYDKILMMGHGTPWGLLNPRNGGYIIDDSFADILREKETISIWCYSNMYFERNNIKGFHTGMIISEVMEAFMMLSYCPFTKEELLENMEYMSNRFNECIEDNPHKIQAYMRTNYNRNDVISAFNRKNMIVVN